MSGSASRAKGKRAANAVIAWLQAHGHPFCANRAPGEDGDDVIGVPGLSIEIKDHKTMALAAWVAQAQSQAHGRPAVVIHKRARKADVGDWYATLTVADLFALIGDEK